jgi:hypothetical protein
VPDGPVLVVGGGNSGFQIAAELAASRPVNLSIATKSPMLPQRPGGQDLCSRWAMITPSPGKPLDITQAGDDPSRLHRPLGRSGSYDATSPDASRGPRGIAIIAACVALAFGGGAATLRRRTTGPAPRPRGAGGVAAGGRSRDSSAPGT